MADWFRQHRQQWIEDMLTVYRFINREHPKRKSGISTPQASLDLQLFARTHPQRIRYDLSRKCYVRDAEHEHST